jgi:UPF0755 protein
MNKKILSGILILIILLGILFTWVVFGPGTAFQTKSQAIYIPSANPTRDMVMDELNNKNILNSPLAFSFLAGRAGYWDDIRPGKYVIEKGASTFKVLRLLKNGRQTPVRLVINKFRTREELAGYIGRQMEMDSTDVLRFFNSPDSTKNFGLDTNNIVTAIIPNTYEMYWTTASHKVLRRLYDEHNKFWTQERMDKLPLIGLKKEEAYILASIVEEETNKNDEKPTMASVYLNRMKKNMSLSADPTVKFALRNFGLKRITFPLIRESASSPYNTYVNKGLPPGPICTPSIKTIDAVLNAAQTDYIFFCARPDFSGYHSFASNEQDHYKNARAYQKALDSLLIK